MTGPELAILRRTIVCKLPRLREGSQELSDAPATRLSAGRWRGRTSGRDLHADRSTDSCSVRRDNDYVKRPVDSNHSQMGASQKVLCICASNGYAFAIKNAKDSGLRIRVDRVLRAQFAEACRAANRPATQVLREFMRRKKIRQTEEEIRNSLIIKFFCLMVFERTEC